MELRVLLADDHDEVRRALRLLLEQEQEVSITGEAADLRTLLQHAQAEHPDMVLLDWTMLHPNAQDTIHSLRNTCPNLCIIILSGHPEARRQALAAGADAFISKIDPPQMLIAALSSFSHHR